MQSDKKTLTREELYELAWTKPVTQLAKEFGLSDVGLAKRFRKLQIPVPGRGHWARIQHGQTPRRPKLPKLQGTELCELTLSFSLENGDLSSPVVAELPPLQAEIAEMQILEVVGLDDLHPAVKRTALFLKRPWRAALTWKHGQRKGPKIDIRATEPTQDRALKIADALLRAAGQLQWKFIEAPSTLGSEGQSFQFGLKARRSTPTDGVLEIDGETIAIRIEERRRRVAQVLDDEDKHGIRIKGTVHTPNWDDASLGEVRIRLTAREFPYISQKFEDRKKGRLEIFLRQILQSIADMAAMIKQTREERRLEEVRRQREQDERRELERIRGAHMELVHELERQAGAWHYARILRSYTRAARRNVGDQRLEAKLLDRKVDFLDWADAYIDQLDPLQAAERNPAVAGKSFSYYVSLEQKVGSLLFRLLGGEWQSTPKIGAFDESETDEHHGVVPDK